MGMRCTRWRISMNGRRWAVQRDIRQCEGSARNSAPGFRESSGGRAACHRGGLQSTGCGVSQTAWLDRSSAMPSAGCPRRHVNSVAKRSTVHKWLWHTKSINLRSRPPSLPVHVQQGSLRTSDKQTAPLCRGRARHKPLDRSADEDLTRETANSCWVLP